LPMPVQSPKVPSIVDTAFRTGLLAGRSAQLVVTMGMPALIY
jgi:putative NADPH-quinone reductase